MEGDIASLSFDEQRVCTGVRMIDGSVLKADRIILFTSGDTANLLAESASNRPVLQVDSRHDYRRCSYRRSQS